MTEIIQPYDSVPQLGLALRYSERTTGQQHVGILFRSSNQEIFLLHQGWHYHGICERPEESFLWLVPEGFTEDELTMLTAQCLAIAKNNPRGLPYAFNNPDSPCFDGAGRSLLSDEGRGLTCATFVLAIFQTWFLPLVDASSWEAREEDEAWFQHMIALMKRCGVPKDHVHAVEAAKDCVRFRPDEVLGAGLNDDPPVDFATCQPLAQAAREALDDWYDVGL